MTKRIRKLLVKPEQRLEWFRRHEMGESVPKIADTDDFDVRTVRKHIELAKQEREVKEARAAVLRNALEQHYDDLRKFAEKVNSQISGAGSYTSSSDDDFMEAALRQHLPRSPIWTLISRRQTLQQRADEEQQKLERAIEQLVKADKRLTPLTEAGLDGVIPGVVTVLVAEVKQWSQGNTKHTLRDSLVIEPAGEGLVNPRFGFSHMGPMGEKEAEDDMQIVRDVLGDMESSLRDSQEYHDLEKAIAEISRLGGKLREELAVIRLRRIVPGRCRYCPL